MKKFTRTGAYALIIQDGKILLTRKTSGPFVGFWDLPGGGIEFSESPIQALHRELLEETALKAEALTLLTTFAAHGEHEDYSYHFIGIIFRAHNLTPIANIIPEEEGRWFPLLDQTQFTPFVRQLFLEKFINMT